jgi:probable HAF family extracellular repeat protein
VKSLRLMSISAINLFAALSIPLWLVAQEQARKELPSYIVTDLGTFGGIAGRANAVNNRGSVVGDAFDPEGTASRAFLWQNGAATDLGTLGGPISSAHFLNERGEVTGSAETSTPDPLGENFCGSGLTCLPFLWKDGLMAPLPTLGGNGVATGINNRGQVVGGSENTTPDPTCPSPSTTLEIKAVVWE